MFKNKFFILILLPAIIITSDLFGQSVILKPTDGVEVSESLSDVQTITFLNGNLLINYKDGGSNSFSITAISSLYFSSVSTGTRELTLEDGSGDISIFPNPAGDIINFKNAPQESFYISVFRIDGKQVLNEQVSSGGQSLNISSLESGLYIIKVNNQAFKLIKL